MQESIDKLSKIAGVSAEGKEQVPVLKEELPDDFFDDEPEAPSVVQYHENPLPPPVKDKRAKPFLTFFGAGAAVLMVLTMMTRGCSNDKEVEPIGAKPQNQGVSESVKKIASLEAEKERLQRSIEDLQSVKPATAASKGKKGTKGQQIAAAPQPYSAPVSYSPPVDSYRPAVAASQVPATYSPPRSTPSFVRAEPSRRDDRELVALRAELAELKRSQIQQVAAELPQALPVQEVVASESVQQVDGGLEEQAILTDSRIAEIPAGSEAIAVLNTPIDGQQSPVMLTLKTGVTDARGGMSLPPGTRLMGTAGNVEGVIRVSLSSVLVNGKAVPVPPQSVWVYSSGNKPLMAKKLKGGKGFGNTLLSGLLDAGGAIASSITQPRSTSQFSSSSGTFSSTTNSNPSLGNALISGGGALAQSIGGNLKQNLTKTDGPVVYGLEAGVELRLVFSAPMQMLSASAALPQEVSLPVEQTPISEPAAYVQDQQILSLPENLTLE